MAPAAVSSRVRSSSESSPSSARSATAFSRISAAAFSCWTEPELCDGLDINLAAQNSSAATGGRMKSKADFLTSRFKGATLAVTFMATKSIIKPAKSPVAVGPYNHAVRVGDLLFCAGQIPISPADGNLVVGDIKVQTERVLENVKAILDDQKLTFANVVKSTVFLTDLANFAGMNEVYAKYFTENFPARSTIQVAGLPKGASVEIEVVAHF